MRLRAPSRGLALSAALLLSLTACNSGSPEEDGSASPTTTAPASASDGGSSEGSGSESEGSDGAGSGEPAESSDADSTEAGGDGEYVPASEDGPAQNVPKPEMPEAMKEETEEGAKAAVQYWWDTVTYLQETGDAGPMGIASHDSCDFCKSYAADLVGIYNDGGWHSGSKVTVTSALTGVVNSEMKILEVTTLLDTSAGKTFDASGNEVEDQSTAERKDEPWLTDVRFDSEAGHWRTTFVSYEGE